MEQVLKLSQSYEPIEIINWQEAIKLITLGKVEVLKEYDGKVLRSTSVIFNFPAVVRLVNSFRRPRKKVKFGRANIIARDKWRCCYCGDKLPASELTYDHVTPKSRGGKTDWENIVTACIPCNNKKGNRTPREAGMRLRKKPSRPDWAPIFSLKMSEHVPQSWRDFCYW